MPRYFFNSVDGKRDDDERGTELPNHGAARVHAIQYAGDIMRSEPGVLWDGREFKVEVNGDGGTRLFTIICHAINEPASGQD